MPGFDTIAIIDDDASMRRLNEKIVRGEGWHIKSFASGDIFLKHTPLEDFAAILLDIRMPGSNGFTVLRALEDRGCVSPVIVLTGYGGISEAVDAIKLGATDFLMKPYIARDLVAMIYGAISHHSDTRPRAAIVNAATTSLSKLSPRQMQVLCGLVEGDQSKAIAYRLALSVRTVELYRAQLLQRLDVKNTTGAIKLAMAGNIDCEAYVRLGIAAP